MKPSFIRKELCKFAGIKGLTSMPEARKREIEQQNVITHLLWKTIEEEEERAITSQPILTDEEWLSLREAHACV